LLVYVAFEPWITRVYNELAGVHKPANLWNQEEDVAHGICCAGNWNWICGFGIILE